MYKTENPVLSHWASIRLPAFLAGKFPNSHYTPIYVGQNNVGKVQDGEFIKKILGSKHIYRKRPGFLFGIDSLKKAEKAGACRVKIIDLETGVIYRAAISTIWIKGFHRNHSGYEPQIGLDMHLWCKGNEPVFEQPGLWR